MYTNIYNNIANLGIPSNNIPERLLKRNFEIAFERLADIKDLRYSVVSDEHTSYIISDSIKDLISVLHDITDAFVYYKKKNADSNTYDMSIQQYNKLLRDINYFLDDWGVKYKIIIEPMPYSLVVDKESILYVAAEFR